VPLLLNERKKCHFDLAKPNPQRPQTVHVRYPAEGSDYGYMERSESLGGVSRWPSANQTSMPVKTNTGV
jgi:hypothetical protein